MSTTFTPPRPDQWEGPAAASFTPPPVDSWQGPAPNEQVTSSVRYLTAPDYQPPPPEPGVVERFGKQYASVLGVPDLLDIIRGSNRYGTPQEVAARGDKAKAALGHVVAGLRDEPARVGGELVGIVQSMLDPKQNTADMSMHMLGAIPMLGPNLQGFVHDVWSKKYPEAAADLAALATLTKGPKVIEAAGEALPRVTQAVETVPAVVAGAAKGGWQGATGPTVLPIKVKGVQLAEIPNVPASLSGAIAGGTAGAAAGGLFGGHAGAVGGAVTGALGGAAAPIVRGAISGVRSALDEAAAARAAAAGSIPPDVTVLSPDYFDRLRLPPGPTITPPPPPPESYVRSVPAMYPTGPNPARALPAPPTVITPEAPIVPPDTSFVRSVPAQYPEVIPPTLRANTAAADLAGQLEASMRVETIADYLARNKIPNAMLETFGDKEWKMIADQAGVRAPSPENIQAIRSNLAEYEAAATQPAEVGKMAPAEAKADFEQRRATRAKRKPPAVAEEAAPAAPEAPGVPEPWRGTPPAEGGAVAPTASDLRVEGFAKHFAEGDIPTKTLEGLPNAPAALLQLEELGRALGIEGRPAPAEVQQIIDRVKQLRGEGPAPTAATEPAGPLPPAPPTASAEPLKPTPIAQAKADFEAAKAAPDSMAATMGPEWNRWAHLQAKRGSLTDAEWSEFVKLDEKFGPPAAAPPATLGELMQPKGKPPKEPATMTAAEINRRLDQLDKKSSELNKQFIDEGRGQERPSEYAKKTDPLSSEMNAVHSELGDLRGEIARRYGPNPPSRLPPRLGPIKAKR